MAINTGIKNNTIKSIKIVCGGMAATPKIAKATEKYLKNKKINYENISKAKLIISKEFSPLIMVLGGGWLFLSHSLVTTCFALSLNFCFQVVEVKCDVSALLDWVLGTKFPFLGIDPI